MSKYRLLSLYWLIPAYLAFLVVQQVSVYNGSMDTYNTGTLYEAEVIDMEVKQIAAQSNGYIVIRFQTDTGETIERKMTLSIQMAQQLLQSARINVSYLQGAYPEIVMHPTYQLQVKTSLFNASVAGVGLILTVIFGVFVQRYSNRKSADETADDFAVQRVDV